MPARVVTPHARHLLPVALLVLGLLVTCSSRVAAHPGRPAALHDLARDWRPDPLIAVPLAVLALLHGRGRRRERARRRSRRGGAGRPTRRDGAAVLGWLTLVVALVSPLHPLGEVLFSAHMAQHMLLLVVATPLLVLARPVAPLVGGVPGRWRGPVARLLRTGPARALLRPAPLPAWLFHAAVLWAWHAPPLYAASVAHPWVHALQHLSFLAAGLLFWESVLRGLAGRGGSELAVGTLSLFTTTLHTGVLGALLTFLGTPLYAANGARTLPGLTPLEDQQLAGLLMWVPGGLTYVAAGLALVGALLGERQPLREALP